MSRLPSFDALRARFSQHERTCVGEPGCEAALAAALEAIGWRSAGDDAAVFLFTGYGTCIIDACVNKHRDVAIAAGNFADLMRQYAPPDTDFLATADFGSAAEEILHLYVFGVTG